MSKESPKPINSEIRESYLQQRSIEIKYISIALLIIMIALNILTFIASISYSGFNWHPVLARMCSLLIQGLLMIGNFKYPRKIVELNGPILCLVQLGILLIFT